VVTLDAGLTRIVRHRSSDAFVTQVSRRWSGTPSAVGQTKGESVGPAKRAPPTVEAVSGFRAQYHDDHDDRDQRDERESRRELEREQYRDAGTRVRFRLSTRRP